MDGSSRNADHRIAALAANEDITEFDIFGYGMAQWRRERPDIDCSGKGIVGRIPRVQDVIPRAANAALDRHGLRYQEYAVLTAALVDRIGVEERWPEGL